MNDTSFWPLVSVVLPALAASVLVAMLFLVMRVRRLQKARHETVPQHLTTGTSAGNDDRQIADRLQVVAARLVHVRQRLDDAARAHHTLQALGHGSQPGNESLPIPTAHEHEQACAALDDQADALQHLAQWYALRNAGPWPTETQCAQLATTGLADLTWRLRHHLDETETRLTGVRQLYAALLAATPMGPLHQRIRLRLLHNLQNWEADELARGDTWRALASNPHERETADLAALATRPTMPLDNTVLTALVSDIATLNSLTAHPWMRGAAPTDDATASWLASLTATRDELHSRVEAFLEMDELLGDALPDDALLDAPADMSQRNAGTKADRSVAHHAATATAQH